MRQLFRHILICSVFFAMLFPAVAGAETTKVTAAVVKDFPPLYMLDGNGHPEGFAIDILDHISDQADFEVEYLIVENWSEAMEAVRQGRADFIPGIGISPTRLAEFAFSEEIEIIPVSCFVRTGNYSIKSITDLLQGYRTAVIGQSAAMTKLQKVHGVELVAFENIESALFQLLAGEVDAFVFPEPVLLKKVRDIGVEDTIKVVGEPLMELKRGYLLQKQDVKQLKKKLDVVIEELTASQEYFQFYKKWYGAKELFWTPQKIFYSMSSILFVAVASATLWRFVSVTRLNRRLVSNIEKREKVEADRKELMKSLEMKNHELQSIVYIASHDLRSPLVNIHGFSGELSQSCAVLTEMLKEQEIEKKSQINELLSVEIPESLGFIQTGASKMQNLLDALLQVSRVGSIKFNFKDTDVKKIVDRIINTLSFEIQEQEIEVSVGDMPNCLGDSDRIDQVFSNIISNAIKYCSPDRKGKITITGKIEDDQSVYCVEDNGMGISANYYSKIFELFHRLNPLENTDGEGIGLTIAARIISRHNGRIWVDSELDAGSKFYIAIPRA